MHAYPHRGGLPGECTECVHNVAMHNNRRYNEAMTQIAPASDAAADGPPISHQYLEDDRGFLYDTGFREILIRLAKADPETITRTEAMRALVMAGKHLGQLLEEAMGDIG